ncbi:hypothetical protein HCN44_010248 [Aphidius gifuensis]|uniref:Mediator of RNA polymerase II transcription subunit 4 n=1 Tax=Aphidius gifuensis TaxID=684658 RepID=A0A834XW89_APHGI|nr:hypothetical protein HCN44_010248 [Aphidius gifuensis]
MASNKSTKELLISIVDDIELIAKEMIENTIAPKTSKLSTIEHGQLTDLLVVKDNELKSMLKRADEQAKTNLRMDALKAEVERQDQDIQQLQKKLKEAEQILATAIYQAKQKLQSIARANKRPVPSEELIKFSHRISASNAICAPLSWQQGDPRRPYPTEPLMSSANQFAWHPSGEIHMSMGGQSVAINTHKQENEDVEVMSTDSSSSSSSDSQ